MLKPLLLREIKSLASPWATSRLQIDSGGLRTDQARSPERIQWPVVGFFFAMCVGLLVLQKVGVPLNAGVAQASLPIFYLGLAGLVVWKRPKIAIPRALLFAVLLLTVAVSVAFNVAGQSSASLLLFFALYSPFIFYFDINRKTCLASLNVFILFMIAACAAEGIQHLIQLTSSWKNWINLDRIVPDQYLVPQYAYLQPVAHPSKFSKPNAVVFLEVSILAQFIGLALILEILYFQRLIVMAVFAAGILVSFSGTGLVLLMLVAPLLLYKPSPRLIAVTVFVIVVASLLALKINWFGQIEGRMDEFQTTGTSGEQRFVAPLKLLADFTSNSLSALYTGWGAGGLQEGYNLAWWPIAKVTVEYGMLTALAFYVFFIFALFESAPSRRAAWAFFVFYNFLGGGFVLPFYVLPCLIFCSLFRVPNAQQAHARRIRRPSSGAPIRSTRLTHDHG